MNDDISIIRVIKNNPGIKFRELMRETRLTSGSISYHTRKLEKNANILIERTSGNTRFYPFGIVNEEMILIKYLRHRISNKIIILLIKNQRLTLKNIVEMTQVSSSWASISLSKLIHDNIVNMKFDKRKKFYQINKKDLVKKTINKYRYNILDVISDHGKFLPSILLVCFSLLQKLFSDQPLDTILINRMPLF